MDPKRISQVGKAITSLFQSAEQAIFASPQHHRHQQHQKKQQTSNSNSIQANLQSSRPANNSMSNFELPDDTSSCSDTSEANTNNSLDSLIKSSRLHLIENKCNLNIEMSNEPLKDGMDGAEFKRLVY